MEEREENDFMKSRYMPNSNHKLKFNKTPLLSNNEDKHLSKINNNKKQSTSTPDEEILEDLGASLDTSTSVCELILKKVANLKSE